MTFIQFQAYKHIQFSYTNLPQYVFVYIKSTNLTFSHFLILTPYSDYPDLYE